MKRGIIILVQNPYQHRLLNLSGQLPYFYEPIVLHCPGQTTYHRHHLGTVNSEQLSKGRNVQNFEFYQVVR